MGDLRFKSRVFSPHSKALAGKHHALLPPLTAKMEALALGDQGAYSMPSIRLAQGGTRMDEWMKKHVTDIEGKTFVLFR